jgi:hypothetical protein
MWNSTSSNKVRPPPDPEDLVSSSLEVSYTVRYHGTQKNQLASEQILCNSHINYTAIQFTNEAEVILASHRQWWSHIGARRGLASLCYRNIALVCFSNSSSYRCYTSNNYPDY